MKYTVKEGKIFADGEEIEDPTEEQIINAVCFMISLGHGLDKIIPIEKELAGEEVFMGAVEFISLTSNNPKYSKMYDDANQVRVRLAVEAVHTMRKKHDENPSKKKY